MTALLDAVANCTLTLYRASETIEGSKDSIREAGERMDRSYRAIDATKKRLHADTQLQAERRDCSGGRPDLVSWLVRHVIANASGIRTRDSGT